MLSAKKVVIFFFILFVIAGFGMILELIGIHKGRYLAYFAVPLGAIAVISAVIMSFIGRLKNDLKE